eukprot:scaffold25630_cov78-Cyclotella_meneghiniana.AAC.18
MPMVEEGGGSNSNNMLYPLSSCYDIRQLSPIYFLQYIAIYQQKKTNPLKYNPLLLRQCITLNEEGQI